MKTKIYWHIHHDRLWEPLTEPLAERIKYIKGNKPPAEIELRLRLLKPITGRLPVEITKACVAYRKAYVAWDKARAACDKAYVAWDKARAAYDKAYAAWVKAYAAYRQVYAAWDKAEAAWWKACAVYQPAMEALHKLECPDCPWDGKTIFPAERN